MSIQITGLSKAERKLERGARYHPELFRVLSLEEWCTEKGFSLSTGKRLIAAGEGPTLTRLSTRRFGIQRRHDLEWMRAREVAAPLAARDLQDEDQS